LCYMLFLLSINDTLVKSESYESAINGSVAFLHG